MKRRWKLLLAAVIVLTGLAVTLGLLHRQEGAGSGKTPPARWTGWEAGMPIRPWAGKGLFEPLLERAEAVTLPTYPDPITGFFRELECDDGTTLMVNRLAWMEAEAWRNEAENVFATLEENAHPGLAEYGLDLAQMKQDLYTYVEVQSELDAYMEYTDIFESQGEWFSRGTGFNGGQGWAAAEHYRAFVTGMYEAFAFDHGADTPEDHYIFDPQDLLAQLEAEGLHCSLGPYAIESVEEQIADNPIDPWTEKYLYYDGTTPAMGADAVMDREIWAAELENAYGLLLERANPAAGLEDKVETAKNALFSFGPAYGECTSLCLYSNAFFGHWEDTDGQIVTGSIACYAGTSDTARYYRQEVLALRGRFGWRLGKEQLPWAFDPGPYLDRLQERYQSAYGEGYEDRFWPEEAGA